MGMRPSTVVQQLEDFGGVACSAVIICVEGEQEREYSLAVHQCWKDII